MIFAKELILSSLDQWDKGSGWCVHQLAVDALKIHNVGISRQLGPLIDPLEPLHMTIASNWVSAQVEGGRGRGFRGQADAVLR